MLSRKGKQRLVRSLKVTLLTKVGRRGIISKGKERLMDKEKEKEEAFC